MNQGSGLPHFTLLEQIASFKSEANVKFIFYKAVFLKQEILLYLSFFLSLFTDVTE